MGGGSAPVRVTGFQLNPLDPTLTLQNTSTGVISMAGWKLRVGTTTVTLPLNASVAPNQNITLHLGNGTSSANDVYLGPDGLTLVTALRPGARVAVENAQGTAVTEFALPA